MDKKIKELIATKKLSDEQLLKILEAYEPESQSGSENSDAFTKEELDKWIEMKVEEKIKNLPKGQPPIKPTFENPKRPQQWKVLK